MDRRALLAGAASAALLSVLALPEPAFSEEVNDSIIIGRYRGLWMRYSLAFVINFDAIYGVTPEEIIKQVHRERMPPEKFGHLMYRTIADDNLAVSMSYYVMEDGEIKTVFTKVRLNDDGTVKAATLWHAHKPYWRG